MGAVAYTSALADRDYYLGEVEQKRQHIREFAAIEHEEIRRITADRGLEGDLLETVVDRITSNEQEWIDVMMTQEFQLAPIDEKAGLRRSIVVAGSALLGSLIPLLPFLVLPVSTSILASIVVAGLVLIGIGPALPRVQQPL